MTKFQKMLYDIKYAHKLLKHNKETYYKWVSEIK